ncbi:MAG: hypothetical protein JWL60_147 [Gemmatimonadetes bacterium]|jgi:hypothetical protein|nr:hypothetical protein [Gemmatimonadota bacterium]
MATITRRDRLVDLAALVLLVAGVLLYVDGTSRLRSIMQLSYRQPGPRGVRQLDRADRARYECNAGIALAILGCVVGAVSAARVIVRRPGT